ncbi:hypothetical protein D0469_14890 [Peribacillus saganii]|uniref:Family 2 glycosyl transferase n=1 Tax=Peribacillus saganii TaxID=2303992 RepID=A0A372LLP2_9BACI|nr:hypothetical protein [Peribacillus saganii]RFU67530.1 hypothetical protein D0469_14890 [Peribacillus saganii]
MKKLSKTEWKFLGFILLILAVLTSPFWLWHLAPEHKLNTLIVDKTVPDTSYREHKGFTWILNNGRYVKPDGTSFSESEDYIGYQPERKQQKEMPASLKEYQLIYLSDQYGVYENDISTNNGNNRSRKITGGLTVDEIEKIKNGLLSSGHKTLVAEFNVFASPTGSRAREEMSNLLNVDWTGWTGRYFQDLGNDEVPDWLKKNYTQSKEKKWSFSGSGLVFINQEGFIEVITEEELNDEGLRFSLTDSGQDLLDTELNAQYKYWFDIINPRNPDEVVAEYELPIGQEAAARVKVLGIPLTFPAIIHHRNAKYTSYYFSGDFADEKEVPAIYQTKGLNTWKKHIGAKDSFYWTAYVPLMNAILDRGLHKVAEQEKVEVKKVNGVSVNSQTDNRYMQILKNGKWENVLIKGVNMGIAKPDSFPGETAIKKEEYYRWFKQIGDMNANAIRIYTLHPPGFYEALYEYNQTAEKPLYLFHGIWMNEEDLVTEKNVFSDKLTKDFQSDIKQIVDVIHGNGDIPPRPGHASGSYKHDISSYILGYILGIEWDPEAVQQSNIKNPAVTSFDGAYFQTANASPFENWLASMMDFTTQYEVDKYKWQHSMSFTNWTTTDLLNHPAEPSVNEDMVAINPNHIKKKNTFQAGLFASYHIYPYYPDFMNYEKKYINYVDHLGKKNSYEGYLHDLINAHEMPVLVAEFGVPASRGLTHRNPFGFNQGLHSEEEQGTLNRQLFESIVHEKYAGGLVFTWQDEWFKRTWNTMDFDNPDRRPFWSNVQTNEQHFGVLAFEPGKRGQATYPDGNISEWKINNIEPFYENKDPKSILKEMYVSSDEAYVHIRLDYRKTIDWDKYKTLVLFDTIPGQGQKKIKLNGIPSFTLKNGIDFVAKLDGPKQSKLLVDSYYDSFYYQYAESLKMIPSVPYAAKKDNGHFHPIRLALNKAITIPSTNETIPFQGYETGVLKFGNGNPHSKDYDSLTDISISNDKQIVEMRIPWAMLNLKDPSLKEAMGDLWKSGLESKITIKGITIAAVVMDEGNLSSSLPQYKRDPFSLGPLKSYDWNAWEEARYFERLKDSYFIMKDAYKNASVKED